ncbi:MAG: hypothetical protein S0880_13150 [Actinomycetota bacterium]|nr:hypothetical protein [Actinomycetota bacterium]
MATENTDESRPSTEPGGDETTGTGSTGAENTDGGDAGGGSSRDGGDQQDNSTADGGNVDGLKSALAKERQAARDERKARKALEDELAELRQANMSDAEKAVADARREGETAATERYRDRLVRTEVRAAAAGRLADPADAINLLDLAAFEVNDDGSLDTDAIAAAVDELLTSKPYLAASTPARQPAGSADQGMRGSSAVRQLTREDLIGMPPEAVEKAEADGQLDQILGRNR